MSGMSGTHAGAVAPRDSPMMPSRVSTPIAAMIALRRLPYRSIRSRSVSGIVADSVCQSGSALHIDDRAVGLGQLVAYLNEQVERNARLLGGSHHRVRLDCFAPHERGRAGRR